MTDESKAETVISVQGLKKTFRDFWGRAKVDALRGIDLNIKKGEIFGLLGPNGSGKSTAIKILLGLLHATGGKVSVLGRNPRSVNAKERIGYLPEETYVYSYLTPRETLMFYGRLFDMDSKQVVERTAQLLEMVGLEHVCDRQVGEFSKGMARRTGLAQALINNPDLIILDEPTSGLDPIGCRQVKDLMLDLAANGKTILLSSHLLADVEDVCDRIAILYNGQIQAEGKVRDLLEKLDSVNLTMPALAEEKLEELKTAAAKLSGGDVTVGHPSMELESFFVNVVKEAGENANRLSGAAHGKGIATFLRGTSEAGSKKQDPTV
jgi:ABC-2 type transport system ATP-binding protein